MVDISPKKAIVNTTIKKTLINFVLLAATAGAAAALGSQVPKIVSLWRGNTQTGNFSEHIANQQAPLTLYGTTTCPYCEKAREHLKRAGIPFNDRMIDKSDDASALYAKLDQSSVPVLVSANKLIVGFNKAEYDKLSVSKPQK